MNCWSCNTELIWGGDHDYEYPYKLEEGESDYNYSIITNLSCPNCHAYVEVYHGSNDVE